MTDEHNSNEQHENEQHNEGDEQQADAALTLAQTVQLLREVSEGLPKLGSDAAALKRALDQGLRFYAHL